MKTITMADIAREAGVSKATVSRVLSNPELVKPNTRERILDIMRKHSFIPNRIAQNLSGKPAHLVGVVIDEISNFFFIEIAEGIDAILECHDYSMQISSSKWIEERETELIRKLISNRVDGILLAPVHATSESIRITQSSGIPFVLINCIPEDESISYVASDNEKGGEIVADYINTLDKEQTILITGFEHQSLEARVRGFTSRYSRKNPFKRYHGINTFDDGYRIVPHLKARDAIDQIPTILFITNDNVAMGVIKGLVNSNIPVPKMVSVIGFDNIRFSDICRVPLTTVTQSICDMGRIAAQELVDMMTGSSQSVCHHLLPPELIIRESG